MKKSKCLWFTSSHSYTYGQAQVTKPLKHSKSGVTRHYSLWLEPGGCDVALATRVIGMHGLLGERRTLALLTGAAGGLLSTFCAGSSRAGQPGDKPRDCEDSRKSLITVLWTCRILYMGCTTDAPRSAHCQIGQDWPYGVGFVIYQDYLRHLVLCVDSLRGQ